MEEVSDCEALAVVLVLVNADAGTGVKIGRSRPSSTYKWKKYRIAKHWQLRMGSKPLSPRLQAAGRAHRWNLLEEGGCRCGGRGAYIRL